MGWPSPRALRAWKALSMGRVGIRSWSLRPHPLLACPPLFPQAAGRLLVHTHHCVSLGSYRPTFSSVSDLKTVLLPDRYYIGWLCVGINASVTSYFVIAWISQWFLRTRYPRWFAKYNYILGAGTFVSIFSVRRPYAKKPSSSA